MTFFILMLACNTEPDEAGNLGPPTTPEPTSTSTLTNAPLPVPPSPIERDRAEAPIVSCGQPTLIWQSETPYSESQEDAVIFDGDKFALATRMSGRGVHGYAFDHEELLWSVNYWADTHIYADLIPSGAGFVLKSHVGVGSSHLILPSGQEVFGDSLNDTLIDRFDAQGNLDWRVSLQNASIGITDLENGFLAEGSHRLADSPSGIVNVDGSTTTIGPLESYFQIRFEADGQIRWTTPIDLRRTARTARVHDGVLVTHTGALEPWVIQDGIDHNGLNVNHYDDETGALMESVAIEEEQLKAEVQISQDTTLYYDYWEESYVLAPTIYDPLLTRHVLDEDEFLSSSSQLVEADRGGAVMTSNLGIELDILVTDYLPATEGPICAFHVSHEPTIGGWSVLTGLGSEHVYVAVKAAGFAHLTGDNVDLYTEVDPVFEDDILVYSIPIERGWPTPAPEVNVDPITGQ